MGDSHYLIEKYATDNKTTTHLKPLELSAIHEELCRLMGGMISESTLQSATELKTRANTYKEQLTHA